MVSMLLLTTEEVLQQNGFWYCLDSQWVTEEMEPFEEVKYEHMFAKPLTRDLYYAKYPDIQRSESDDENSLSIIGFKNKHQEWKSRLCVKRINAQRRYSNCSRASASFGNSETRRITSLIENRSSEKLAPVQKVEFRNNNERVLDFLRRLQESVPPPPIEDLQHSRDISAGSIEYPRDTIDFMDVELPNYDDFVNDKIKQVELEEEYSLPTTSTLKKPKGKVSFNLKNSKSDFESDNTWYDSIYGVSDLVLWTSDNEDVVQRVGSDSVCDDVDMVDHLSSWSEILKECNVNDDSILRSTESLTTNEVVMSCSNIEADIANLDFGEADNGESGYARFAIYKIHQTLKIQVDCMSDSSSMIDLSVPEDIMFKKTSRGPSHFRTMYCLVSMDDVIY